MGRTILELFRGSTHDTQVDSKAKEGKGTLFSQIGSFVEQEATGIRIRSGVELNNPKLYGNEAIRIMNRSTRSVELMKKDTLSSESEVDGGLIGKGLKKITGGKFGAKVLGGEANSISELRDNVNKKLGVPSTILPNKYDSDLGGIDIIKYPAKLDEIKQQGQGTGLGKYLKSGGTPKTIVKQAAGNLIKEAKDKIRGKLFGTKPTEEQNSIKRSMGDKIPIVYDRGVNSYSKAKSGDRIKEDIANQDFQTSGKSATNISYETPEAIAGKLRVGYGAAKPKITKGNYEAGKTTFTKEDYNKDIVKKRTERIKDAENELIGKRGFRNTDDVINQSGIYTEEDKRIDNISIDEYDFIPLKFQSVVTDETVNFRGNITGLSETVSPSWAGAKFSGNPFNFYTYDGVERSVAFNFIIYPMNSKELLNNWSKIGFLTSLTYPLGNPDIKSGYQSSIGSVRAPLLYFTLGDLYKKREAFIESLQYTVPDNSNWQLDGAQTDYESSKAFFESAGVRDVPTVENGYKLPHMVEVAITMKFLEQRRNTERRENLYGFTPLTYNTSG